MQTNQALHEAENLAEFIEILKAEQGDSNATLGTKIGVAGTTIFRLLHGAKADDETLDKIADYSSSATGALSSRINRSSALPTPPASSTTKEVNVHSLK